VIEFEFVTLAVDRLAFAFDLVVTVGLLVLGLVLMTRGRRRREG
jgi:hypothetical protein